MFYMLLWHADFAGVCFNPLVCSSVLLSEVFCVVNGWGHLKPSIHKQTAEHLKDNALTRWVLVEVINRLFLQLRKLLHSLTVGRCTLTNSDTHKHLDVFTVFLLIRHLQCSKKKKVSRKIWLCSDQNEVIGYIKKRGKQRITSKWAAYFYACLHIYHQQWAGLCCHSCTLYTDCMWHDP